MPESAAPPDTPPIAAPVPVLRFAPSPNGYLHLGHACSALLNEAVARATGGRFLLRIEDIDTARCRPAFTEAILDDLAWLGLHWEEPVRRQSRHFADYRAALDTLTGAGLVYPCFCSRTANAAAADAAGKQGRAPWPRDPDGVPLYPGTCRAMPPGVTASRLASGEPHAWRFDMDKALKPVGRPLSYARFDPAGRQSPVAVDPARWGDVILARKDVPTSYHLSVVVDDALQGVTHVVRGMDLEASTAIHRLLQVLLGLPAPLYHHHGLIRDEAGDKLAKSARSPALRDLRAVGVTAADVRARLGF